MKKPISPEELITPEEAAKLVGMCTADKGYIAMDIYNLCQQSKANDSDRRWVLFYSLTAIFNAGLVAGIRQERAQRRVKIKV